MVSKINAQSTAMASSSDICPNCQVPCSPLPDPPFCPSCRFPLIVVAGKYKLEKTLQKGGFGLLFLARHIGLDSHNERVVKVIKPELLKHEDVKVRFKREVQVTANLSEQNNHIVRIYDDFGEEPELGHYYVMEYLRGKTLADLQPRSQPLPEELTYSIFYQLCKAMAAAHRSQIIHRDLKPTNIFLIRRDHQENFVKVIDFGLARPTYTTGSTITNQQIIGTPVYMSPEQCQTTVIDARSDIYSMGVILYHMLTGQYPYDVELRDTMGWLHAHCHKPHIPLARYKPEIHGAIEGIMTRTLAKNPTDRFENIESLWRAIEPFAPPDVVNKARFDASAPRHGGQLRPGGQDAMDTLSGHWSEHWDDMAPTSVGPVPLGPGDTESMSDHVSGMWDATHVSPTPPDEGEQLPSIFTSPAYLPEELSTTEDMVEQQEPDSAAMPVIPGVAVPDSADLPVIPGIEVVPEDQDAFAQKKMSIAEMVRQVKETSRKSREENEARDGLHTHKGSEIHRDDLRPIGPSPPAAEPPRPKAAPKPESPEAAVKIYTPLKEQPPIPPWLWWGIGLGVVLAGILSAILWLR